MGFVGDLFNGAKGAGYQAQGASMDQANNLYGQTQSGLSQQQNFLNALQGQNGIGNQQSVFGQQQALANQLGEQAQGGGPNPALAQLAQTTGQNVANQAALMAGQRGVGSNPGLMARQIAQQGAATQQQAGGQAAVLRAQQQLAAQQALQGQQSNMANLAGNQVNQQGTALNNYNQYALQGQGNLLGSIANQNNANAGIAGANQKSQAGMVGGLLGGAGALLMAHGGVVPGNSCYACGGVVHGYADGGVTPTPMASAQAKPSDLSAFLASSPTMDQGSAMSQGTMQFMQGAGSGIKGLMKSAPITSATPVAQGGGLGEMLSMAPMALASSGGKIGGNARVSGDSPKNDTVPAMLSPGELVIPRSRTLDPKKTAEFVNSFLGMNLKPAKKGA